MLREWTATVYILDAYRTKVLLIYHAKLQKWLPPGGHVEPNEMPHETAIREALEETGVHVRLFKDEHIWINRWNASSFPRPFMCLLEDVPSYQNHPAHQHMDIVYLGEPAPDQHPSYPVEPGERRWFSMEELEELRPDVEIFEETLQVLRYVFKMNSKELAIH